LSIYLKEHPEVKNIVYMDDAVYSSMHLSRVMYLMANNLPGGDNKEISIHFLVPFMTRSGHAELNSSVSDYKNIAGVFLYKYECMPTLRELINELGGADRQSLMESLKAIPEYVGHCTLTYFQHRIGDLHSFVPFGWDVEEKATIGEPLANTVLPPTIPPYWETYPRWLAKKILESI
jgi:hypothetical protein